MIARVLDVEHALIAETGTEESSRYVVMAGVHVDEPAEITRRLTGAGEERVVDLLQTLAFDIRIAFGSKQKLSGLGDDWRYALLENVVQRGFNPQREKQTGYAVVAHLAESLPGDFEWLDAYLTNASYGLVRVQTKAVAHDDGLLLLPSLVARRFHDAVEDDAGRPTAARDRYDAIAPLVKAIEDVGLGIRYGHLGTAAASIVRITQSG
jgi:hypothetical protein